MVAAAKPEHERTAWERFCKDVIRDKWLYLLLLPGIVFLIIFRYIPIFGNVIAFMDYNPYDAAQTTWVGLKHFQDLLTRPQFLQVFGNTLYISILKMVCGFPVPIILALMMNEMKNLKFKKVAQTLLYLPNFISWVVLAGLIMNMLDPDTGLVTGIINSITGEQVQVLTDTRYFVPMLIVTDIYKGAGWGTIIYFAALSGIDPQLYEAAEIDGARKWKQLLHVTIPGISTMIIMMQILRMGAVFSVGADKILLLYSPANYEFSDVINTYVYRMGMTQANYGLSTAVHRAGLQRGRHHRHLRLQNRYPECGLLVLHGGRSVQVGDRVRHDSDRQHRCQEDRQRGHLVRRE